VFVLVDWQAVALFLGAAGLALLLHLGWRRELRGRFGSPGLQRRLRDARD
jgi:hypothetical protein